VFLRKPFDHTEVRQLASSLTEKWNLAYTSQLKMDELEALVTKRTEELQTTVEELQDALLNIKTLRGLVPICASCKKVRDDKGFWKQVESYVAERTDAQFSHGICPDCLKELYSEFLDDDDAEAEKDGK